MSDHCKTCNHPNPYHSSTCTEPLEDCSRAATCSAFRFWWEDMENGCPQLVLDNDEQFAVAVWNAAIERALLVIPGGNLCDPQEVADTIRELIEPNAKEQTPT